MTSKLLVSGFGGYMIRCAHIAASITMNDIMMSYSIPKVDLELLGKLKTITKLEWRAPM